jgi:hypothetical protein
MKFLVCSVGVLLTLAVFAGCDRSPSSSSGTAVNHTVIASKYLLATEPANAISITQAAEALSTDSAIDSAEGAQESDAATGAPQVVTLIGKIDAGDFPAFQEKQATFMLSELPADGHGLDDPDHEDNCPFCKRRAAKAPKAIVNMIDADGKTIAMDARKLLGLVEGERIIAVGTARFDESVNMLTLQCSGVYRSP